MNIRLVEVGVEWMNIRLVWSSCSKIIGRFHYLNKYPRRCCYPACKFVRTWISCVSYFLEYDDKPILWLVLWIARFPLFILGLAVLQPCRASWARWSTQVHTLVSNATQHLHMRQYVARPGQKCKSELIIGAGLERVRWTAWYCSHTACPFEFVFLICIVCKECWFCVRIIFMNDIFLVLILVFTESSS